MPAYTCSVVAHAVVASGNRPRFVDIALPDYNMDLDCVEAALSERTGAVIATHLFGYPLDVSRLQEIVSAAEARFGTRIAIIQDCAHSFEARFDGRSVSRAGDVAFYGLNISKIMTSIFGGMADHRRQCHSTTAAGFPRREFPVCVTGKAGDEASLPSGRSLGVQPSGLPVRLLASGVEQPARRIDESLSSR